MRKSVVFLSGVLIVLVGIFSSYNLNASTHIQLDQSEMFTKELSQLESLNVQKYVKVNREDFR